MALEVAKITVSLQQTFGSKSSWWSVCNAITEVTTRSVELSFGNKSFLMKAVLYCVYTEIHYMVNDKFDLSVEVSQDIHVIILIIILDKPWLYFLMWRALFVMICLAWLIFSQIYDLQGFVLSSFVCNRNYWWYTNQTLLHSCLPLTVFV